MKMEEKKRNARQLVLMLYISKLFFLFCCCLLMPLLIRMFTAAEVIMCGMNVKVTSQKRTCFVVFWKTFNQFEHDLRKLLWNKSFEGAFRKQKLVKAFEMWKLKKSFWEMRSEKKLLLNKNLKKSSTTFKLNLKRSLNNVKLKLEPLNLSRKLSKLFVETTSQLKIDKLNFQL